VRDEIEYVTRFDLRQRRRWATHHALALAA
jgi:hypothetical protein